MILLFKVDKPSDHMKLTLTLIVTELYYVQALLSMPSYLFNPDNNPMGLVLLLSEFHG